MKKSYGFYFKRYIHQIVHDWWKRGSVESIRNRTWKTSALIALWRMTLTLKMPFCAIFHRPVISSSILFNYLKLLIILGYQSLQNLRRKLAESLVIIKLTYSKVNKMASNAVYIDIHEVFQELELVLIRVSTSHGLLCQPFGELKILNRNFSCLFEHNQTIDVPWVES